MARDWSRGMWYCAEVVLPVHARIGRLILAACLALHPAIANAPQCPVAGEGANIAEGLDAAYNTEGKSPWGPGNGVVVLASVSGGFGGPFPAVPLQLRLFWLAGTRTYLWPPRIGIASHVHDRFVGLQQLLELTFVGG